MPSTDVGRSDLLIVQQGGDVVGDGSSLAISVTALKSEGLNAVIAEPKPPFDLDSPLWRNHRRLSEAGSMLFANWWPFIDWLRGLVDLEKLPSKNFDGDMAGMISNELMPQIMSYLRRVQPIDKLLQRALEGIQTFLEPLMTAVAPEKQSLVEVFKAIDVKVFGEDVPGGGKCLHALWLGLSQAMEMASLALEQMEVEPQGDQAA